MEIWNEIIIKQDIIFTRVILNHPRCSKRVLLLSYNSRNVKCLSHAVFLWAKILLPYWFQASNRKSCSRVSLTPLNAALITRGGLFLVENVCFGCFSFSTHIHLQIYSFLAHYLSWHETKNINRFKLNGLYFDGGFAGLAFSVFAVILLFHSMLLWLRYNF